LLFISHDLALVARLCRCVLVMYAGRIVEDAPMGQLLTQPRHPYSAALLACSPELGRPDKPLPAVAGEPPPPGTVHAGCPFAPRCPRAQPVCRDTDPPLVPVAAGHQARCLFPLQGKR